MPVKTRVPLEGMVEALASPLRFSCRRSQVEAASLLECRGILGCIPRHILRKMETKANMNSFKRGQVIFYEGNAPLGIYFIAKGAVKLTKAGSLGRQVITRIAQANDIFGYRAFFSGTSYAATAQAVEDSQICFLSKEVFYGALSHCPALAFAIIRKLCLELGEAEGRMLDLVDKSVKSRLAGLLLRLSGASDHGDKAGIELSVTRAEIAEMIGTTQESVIRVLGYLRRRGAIGVCERKIVVHNAAELRKIERCPSAV